MKDLNIYIDRIIDNISNREYIREILIDIEDKAGSESYIRALNTLQGFIERKIWEAETQHYPR